MSLDLAEKPMLLSQFGRQCADCLEPASLKELRQKGTLEFERQGIPTVKHEEWKYTSLRDLEACNFVRPAAHPLEVKLIRPFLNGLDSALQYVFVNGLFDRSLSNELSGHDGLEIALISENQGPIGDLANLEAHPFAALNTAAFEEGLYIRVLRNSRIEKPIHLIFLATGSESTASYPRLVLVAEDGSEATVVETYGSTGSESHLCIPVTETFVASNAKLEHVKVQEENANSFHIALQKAKIEGDGTYLTYNITFGGGLTRNDIEVFLNGQNVHARMDGAYVLGGNQHCDNHTRLDHAMPHCDSFEVYKGVLDGDSRGVFNGKIFVHEDAQKTDAKQTNQALLLSPTASIDTKPQLEIFADDVKCTHGATIGQLRADAMFYLRARGIPYSEARAMLVFAFAAEVIEKISHEGLRQSLESKLLAKLAM